MLHRSLVETKEVEASQSQASQKYFQTLKEKSQIASVCKLTYDNLNSCTDIMLKMASPF